MSQWDRGGHPEPLPASLEQASPVFVSFRDWVTAHGVCNTGVGVYGLGEELTDEGQWAPDSIMVGDGPIEYKANVRLSTIESSSAEAREAAGFLGIHTRGGLRMRYREQVYVPAEDDDLEYRLSCMDLHVVLKYIRSGGRLRRVTARYRFEDHPDGGNVLHGYRLFGFNASVLPKRAGGAVSAAECEAFTAIVGGLSIVSSTGENFKSQKLSW